MAFEANSMCCNALAKSGTGTTYTLGAAVAGKQSIATAFTNGNSGFFCIYSDADFEAITGTVNTGTGVVTRTAILASSNAGAAVNWSGSQVIGDFPAAERIVMALTGPLQLNASGEALLGAADAAAQRAALSSRSDIQFASLTTTASISGGSGWQSIAGLALTVAVPTATAKVELLAILNVQSSGVVGTVNARIYDGSAAVLQGDTAGTRHRAHTSEFSGNATHWTNPHVLHAVVTPGAAGNVTYTPQWETEGGTAYLNRSSTDTDNQYHSRTASTFMARIIP